MELIAPMFLFLPKNTINKQINIYLAAKLL